MKNASYIYVSNEVKDALIYDLTRVIEEKQEKIDELVKQSIDLGDKIASLTGRNKVLEQDCETLRKALKEVSGDEF